MRKKTTEKQKAYKKLKKELKTLTKDLDALVSENKKYNITASWVESWPIENLKESLDAQYKHPRARVALSDFKIKEKLRRDYHKKIDRFSVLEHELAAAEIDCILEKIEIALKDPNEGSSTK